MFHAIRLFYFVYFAVMGLMLPFFPVYLASLGMNAITIGFMVGLLSAARILAPPLFAYWLDQRQQHTSVVLALASCVAAAVVLPLNHTVSWLPLFSLLVLIFSMLWAGMLPAADALAIAMAKQYNTDYARIRLWGSLGFIASSMLAGMWLEGFAIHYLPWVVSLLMLLLALSAMGFRLPTASPVESMAAVVRHAPQPWSPELRRLMLGGLLMQCSHGAYYGFFSLYLIGLGYSNQDIGLLWVVSVLAEVLLMAYAGKWLQQQALGICLHICFLLAALRWLGIAFAEDYQLLLIFQLLHAASFAAFHVASVTSITRIAPTSQHTSAQAWFAAIGFGLGGVLGILMAGWLVDVMSIQVAFLLSALIALIGAWLYHR